MRQRERKVAKKLVDDIIATEEVIEKLENRDAALSEIRELMRAKLLPNDMVIYNFISSVASSENEMNLKLSAMKQELEHLKRLRNVLVDNGGFEKNKLTCVICLDHKSEFMAAVCGHTCCRECSEKSTLSCHVCRGPAVWKRIFI